MSLETRKQDLLDTIDADIATNGTQAITALVLAPILKEIVEWAAAFFGDGDELSEDNLVNEVIQAAAAGAGITIRTGTADPNTTPPATFNIGDFYKRTSGGVTIGWYQYNDIGWAPILEKESQYVKGIRVVAGAATITEEDHTIIYTGAGGDNFDQDTAANKPNRVIRYVNQGSSANTLTNSYLGLDGAATSDLPAETAIELQSDGTNWYRIA